MTSIPVNHAKSVLMDFAKKTPDKAQSTGETGSFTDVLKGQTGGTRTKAETTQTETDRTAKTRTEIGRSARDRMKQEDTSDVTTGELRQTDTGTADALQQAGEEMVTKIAEELDISEEEVLRAMELLGLTFAQMLLPENLTAVVLKVSGETDPMALITGAKLSDALKNLNQFVSDIREELEAAFNISEEQLEGLLEQVKQEENLQPANTEREAGEKEPQIVVENFTDEKTDGKLLKSNPTEGDLTEAVPQGNSTTVTDSRLTEETGEETGQESNKEHTAQNQNPILQNLNQSVETQGTGSTEAVPFAMQQTREIMDQILNYMRIQIKPEMTQLEMQLHPESLGNVNVHIASKEGVITAQFTAQNETVRAALESQMVQLRETFTEQGIKVEAIEVSVQANGFRQEYEGSRERENMAEDDRKKSVRRINLRNPELFAEESLSEEEQLTVSMMEANGSTVDYTA